MELSDDSGDGSSSDNENDDPPVADAYTKGQSSTTDRKGKGVSVSKPTDLGYWSRAVDLGSMGNKGR